MNWYHLSVDTSTPGEVWFSFYWQARDLLAKTVSAHLIDVQSATCRKRLRALRWLHTRREGQSALRRLRSRLDSELGDADSVLEVHGASHLIISTSDFLAPLWKRFSRRVLTISDTIDPRSLSSRLLARFDLIRCFCPALARSYRECTEVPVLYQPTGIDALDQIAAGNFRPIDMIVVGRRWNEFHEAVHPHYNRPESHRLFLDFGTRPQGPRLPEHEWRLLMATYAKSKIAFCFEPSANPRFAGRSSMTHRWPQAWTAGCTVVGRRPTSPEVAAYMDWPESTIEVPEAASEWIPFLESILDDESGLVRRRERNTLEALRRHDGRLRVRELLQALGLPLPERLSTELTRLEQAIGQRESALGVLPLPLDWQQSRPVRDQVA